MPGIVCRTALCGLLILAGGLGRQVLAQPTLTTRIVDRIPRTPQEVAEAHDKSDLICSMLPQGVPLVQAAFAQRDPYTIDVRRGGQLVRENLLVDWGRWPVIDYGTLMTVEDRNELPFFTSGVILDVIDNTYISLQARVQRVGAQGEPYLSPVPVACAGEFGKLDTATEFAALQQAAVSNVHGLGLFLKPGQPRHPQSLRTLVISIKGTRLVPSKDPKLIETVPTLELLFLRLRTVPLRPGQAPADGVRLFAFGTTEGLTKLVSFAPYATPGKPDDCTICSTIRITEYAIAGQLPSARAARSVRVRTAKEFTLPQLNAYTRQVGLAGEAWDNLTEILDAIIDGTLK